MFRGGLKSTGSRGHGLNILTGELEIALSLKFSAPWETSI